MHRKVSICDWSNRGDIFDSQETSRRRIHYRYHPCVRKFVCIGLRDVARAVETNRAALVVCEQNPLPPILTKLLVPLCRAKAVPLLGVKNLAETLARVLNIPRCLTVALRVNHNRFNQSHTPLESFLVFGTPLAGCCQRRC